MKYDTCVGSQLETLQSTSIAERKSKIFFNTYFFDNSIKRVFFDFSLAKDLT